MESRIYNIILAILTLLCTAWVLWGYVFPSASRVQTVHQPIPVMANPEPAILPKTASIAPLLSQKVNVNTATLQELESLPRVGEKMAQAIVAGRPYRSLQDLDKVKGIGSKTLELLAPLVIF